MAAARGASETESGVHSALHAPTPLVVVQEKLVMEPVRERRQERVVQVCAAAHVAQPLQLFSKAPFGEHVNTVDSELVGGAVVVTTGQ